MALESFMSKFDTPPADNGLTISEQWQATSQPGALDKFIDKFNGVTEPYFFYNGTVELRFQVDEHIYYRVGDLGQLTPQDGVTTICHIIDKSNALVPWSAKMVVQKLLRTMPTFEKQEPVVLDPTAKDFIKAGSPTFPVKYIPEMTLEAFEKIALEAKSAPRDKLEEAGDIGHMAHTWLEYYIKAVIAKHEQEAESKLANPPKDERAANCVKAALDWMRKHKVKWIETERKIYSKRYSYAGTMDGLALVSSCDDPLCQGCKGEVFVDRLSIIDWKSSNYLYIEYLYQTAAYEAAYEEEFGVEVLDRWILRLGKEDGEFDPWHTTEEDFQEDFEAFLDALSLTRSVHLTEERMKGQKKQVKEARKAAKEAAKEIEKAEKKAAKEAAKIERRAAKALEKEVLKAKKKAERAALKAQIVPADTEPFAYTPNLEQEVLSTTTPEQREAFAKAMDTVDAQLSGTITGRLAMSKPEPQEPLGNLHTPAVEQPTEILNGTLVTMDFAAIEQRVIASLTSLPQEEVATYGFQLPVEKVEQPHD